MVASAASFEFATATRIIFGIGKLGDAGEIAASLGARALVVSSGSGRAEPLVQQLRERGLAATMLDVAGEPTISMIERGAQHARDARCDVVIAIGGGSVIDAGKA